MCVVFIIITYPYKVDPRVGICDQCHKGNPFYVSSCGLGTWHDGFLGSLWDGALKLSVTMPTRMARVVMTTSSNGNIFCVTGPLWGEFIGDRWIPLTKANDAELWYFFLCAPPTYTLSKQSRWQQFETPWRSFWCHCNSECDNHEGWWLWRLLTATEYNFHSKPVSNVWVVSLLLRIGEWHPSISWIYFSSPVTSSWTIVSLCEYVFD